MTGPLAPRFDVVVPTIGRPSLLTMLDALLAGPGPLPDQVLLVDDRKRRTPPLLAGRDLPSFVRVLPGRAIGPAAARNTGWRASSSPWVAFLDDDVVPPAGWREALAQDLSGLTDDVAASQGRIVVPLPPGRRPTDWERNVAGLETAQWATADLAYRRSALVAVGGFDERFPRAYREDADLGIRVTARGWRIVTGERHIDHPVRPADRWVSVRLQRGNADDPLMRALHGRDWRALAGVPRGRRPRHLAITASAVLGLGALLARRPRLAAIGGGMWLAGTAELAAARIAPGPRTPDEAVTMAASSAMIAPMATWHWLRGVVGVRSRVRLPRLTAPEAVLFDRDGTLVVDVPYNGDPAKVQAVPGAKAVLDSLRARRVPIGVVSNQSGVARGLLSEADVDAVNRRIEEVLGPFDHWEVCPHGPEDGCECRKPKPGMVLGAADALGVDPSAVLVIGDIGADVGAAHAAGARGILVPTPVTLPCEVELAPEVADSLEAAVLMAFGGLR